MKIFRFLVVVGFLAICASAARADGTDPVVTPSGCGGNSGKPCDAVTFSGAPLTFTETFSTSACPEGVTGACADMGVVNNSESIVTEFTLAFVPGSSDQGNYTADCSPETTPGFTCNNIATNVVQVIGTINFEDPDCVIYYTGVNILLEGDASLAGESVSVTFSTPEPSSILLLLSGIMAGLVALKSRRNVLA